MAAVLAIVLAALLPILGRVPAPTSGGLPGSPLAETFSFGAAGDYGFEAEGQSVMTAMGAAALEFVVALGDFSYGDTTEAEWCGFFESKVGDGNVLLIAGNHDESDMAAFTENCDFGVETDYEGVYGIEYFFDYPYTGPLVRFILTSCGLDLSPGNWVCDVGDSHYDFVSNAIDGARAAGIPWVIVGMHKNCISNGGKDCDIGEAMQDLLLVKRVDLVLQGHEHAYLRSKRLVCADDDVFRLECVAAEGEWGQIINIVGTGGRSFETLGGQADEQYFQTWDGNTNGFLRVDVSATELAAEYIPVVGTYEDDYRISRASAPDFLLSADPTTVSVVPDQPGFVNVRVTPSNGFSGTVALAITAPPEVTGSCSPSTIDTIETSTCTVSSPTPGDYPIKVTGTSDALVHSQDFTLVVTEPQPGPDATPPLIVIASPSDHTSIGAQRVTVTGSASDDIGVARVQLSVDGGPWTMATGTDSWSATVTLEGGEREYVIQARALDAADNIGSAEVHIFLDLPEPGSVGFPELTWQSLAVYAGIAAAFAGLGVGVFLIWRRRKLS